MPLPPPGRYARSAWIARGLGQRGLLVLGCYPCVVFEVALTQSAAEDLTYFDKVDQKLILDAIAEQLSHEPLTTTRNRKLLRDNPVASWALRIGEFRVFYDVSADDNVVSVRAVGRKERNLLFIRGMRITL